MFYIYDDCYHNNHALYRALIKVYGFSYVRFVNADDVVQGCLETEGVEAFIMPGGASRFVSSKLKGPGNQRIVAYVKEGGCYVGICAGAYYACRHILWNTGRPKSLTAEGELCFVDGDAVGPIESFCDFKEDCGSYARIVSLRRTDGALCTALYWGGPYLPRVPGAQVLAVYADLPGDQPAVITGAFGKGKYLLFSPHCEVGAAELKLMQFNVMNNRLAELKPLNADELERDGSFVSLLANALS